MAQNLIAVDPDYPDRPWTVCFYGPSGGAGCTTLLVNTALALNGCYLLDLNLIAPGIDAFEEFRPPRPDYPGLVEYVRAFRDSGESPALGSFVYGAGGERWKRSIAFDFLGTEGQGKEDHNSGAADSGTIERDLHACYVMRAGLRDAAYRRDAMVVEWRRFLGIEDAGLLFEDLRAGVLLEYGCEYMLIDAPFGMCEIDGLSTRHLADAVVFVFEANTASVPNLEPVARQVQAREEVEGRPIPRLYVASKVPEVREDRLDPDALELVEQAIEQIEGSPANWLHFDEWRPECDLTGALVHAIPLRPNVSRPHVPDSFLVPGCLMDANLNDIRLTYAFVKGWVEGSRAGVLRYKKAEGEQLDQQRNRITKLKEISDERFAQLVEKLSAVQLEWLAAVPSEILAILPAQRELAIRRVLDERLRRMFRK